MELVVLYLKTGHNYAMNMNWTALNPVLECNSPHNAAFTVAFDVCRASFHDDMALVNEAKAPIVGPIESRLQVEWGKTLSDYFMRWRHDIPPTIPAFLALACDHFGIEGDHRLLPAALTASVLAETQHLSAYHNTNHFREVFVMVMRLCSTHNRFNDIPHDRFYPTDVLLMLIAAAIHDFAHDGQGNFIDGKHMPSRLEKQAFIQAKPFLEKAGMTDDELNIVELMILSTDVSHGKSYQSPSTLLRQAYEAHYSGKKSMPDMPIVMQRFSFDDKLCLMAATLCEADVAPSTGLDYEFSKFTTTLVAEESGVLTPAATTLHGFMTQICHGRYLTPAARHLMAENFTGISLQAEEDSERNVLYA